VHVELSIHQLALMLRSGMTLLAAISSVAEQSSSASLQRTWTTISQQIQSGKGLSEAMAQHRCFPEFVVRLVEVGEQTGNMEVVLRRAANTMRSRRDGAEAIVSATIYPVLILLLSVSVTIYMIIYLIPKLDIYLQSLGKELPAMTQALIDVSFWLRGNYVLLIAFVIIVGTAFALTYFSKEGRLWLDQYALKVPVLGNLLRIGETSAFARSLSVLLKSGITLTEGLKAVEKILSNRFLRQNISAARERIIRGANLVDALNQQAAFGPMLSRMAAVGQQTGEMDVVLFEVAELYDSQFQSKVKRLNAFLTPMMTIAIGGVVGYVYIAFFMALVAAGS
jgi:type II secretory pathway component PulF